MAIHKEYTISIRNTLDVEMVKRGASEAAASYKQLETAVASSMKASTSAINSFTRDAIAQAQRVAREYERIPEAARRAARPTSAGNDPTIREAQRRAREVERINQQTARQAEQNEKIRERAAKSLADVEIREFRRSTNERLRLIKEEDRATLNAARERERVASSGTPLGRIAGGVAIGAIGARVAGFAVSEITQGARAWLEYSSNLETTRIAFTSLLGSADAANAHLTELADFAKRTPFQFTDLVAASQRMQALGINAKQVVPLLNDIGNAVAAAGGGADRLDRVTLALSQMQAKGRVATQEINQLAEAGIPAWRILGEQFGKSRAELVDLVEKGRIGSDTFIAAFQRFSQANFGDLMEKQSHTFSGAMSNIEDILLQTSSTAFKPLFDEISKITVEFSDALQGADGLASVVEKSSEYLASVGGSIAGYIGSGIKEYFKGFNVADHVFGALSFKRERSLLGSFFGSGPSAPNTVTGSFGTFDIPKGASAEDAYRIQALSSGNYGVLGLPAGNGAAPPKLDLLAEKARRGRTADPLASLVKGISSDRSQAAYFSALRRLSPSLRAQIESTATGYGIPVPLALAQIYSESSFKPNADNGIAFGLTQQKPTTASRFLGKKVSGEDLKRDTSLALSAFGKYMNFLFNRYGDWELATLAYHQGEGNVDKLVALLDKGNTAGASAYLKSHPKGAEYIKKIGAISRLSGDAQYNYASEPFANISTDQAKHILDVFKKRRDGLPIPTDDKTDLGELSPELERQRELYQQITDSEDALKERRKFSSDEYIRSLRAQNVDIDNQILDLEQLRKQNTDPQFVAARRLKEVNNERYDIEKRIAAIEDDEATSPYNQALRIQLSLLEDIAQVRGRDEQAMIAQNRAQIELADASVVHGEQVRAQVLDHLAQQKTATESFADGITSAYDSITGALDKGINKLTHGIGFLNNALSSVVHQLTNRLFQKFLDLVLPSSASSSSPSAGASAGGGGWASKLLGNVFGSQRSTSTLTGGFAGGASPVAALLSGGVNTGSGGWEHLAALLGGNANSGISSGGITLPPSLTGALIPGLGNVSIAGQGPFGNAASSAATGSLLSGAGLAGALAPLAPLLGISLGSSLGGSSKLGMLAGGVGGGILGGAVGLSALAYATGGASLAGGGLIAGASTLLTNPITLGVGLAAIAAAVILSKNAARRRDETTRDQLMRDSFTQIDQIVAAVKAGQIDGTGALAQATQIQNQYLQAANALKDSKTRRIAVSDAYRITARIDQSLKPAIKAAADRKSFTDTFVPTFAQGGSFDLARDLARYRHLRFADGGAFQAFPKGLLDGPGTSRSDSIIARVSKREYILDGETVDNIGVERLDRIRARKGKGFADGGSFSGAPASPSAPASAQPIHLTVNLATQVTVGPDTARKIVITGASSEDGREVIVEAVRDHISKERTDGLLGDIILGIGGR